jgi:hypothetical protein
MRSPVLALTSVMLAVAFAAPRAQEPAPDQSLDRMRSVLARPPLRLALPESEANFKVHIEAIHPMHDIFATPPWATDPVGWQPPGIGFDLLSVFRYVAKSAADAKREHDVRLAREDVQRAIADYCAAQPNANTIQICSTSPAIR